MLVDAKIKSANLDLENDQLACKIQQKNDEIKKYGERITALEVDLLKTKQELGEALNAVYEYEVSHHDKFMLGGGAGGTMAFGGSGSFSLQHNQNDSGSGNETTMNADHVGAAAESTRSGGDGGSGSTIKKTSYKDKIKNFMKKHTSSG